MENSSRTSSLNAKDMLVFENLCKKNNFEKILTDSQSELSVIVNSVHLAHDITLSHVSNMESNIERKERFVFLASQDALEVMLFTSFLSSFLSPRYH